MNILSLLLFSLLAHAEQSNGVLTVKTDKPTYVANDRAKILVYQKLEPTAGRKQIVESTFDGAPIRLIPDGVRWQVAYTPRMSAGGHPFVARVFDVGADLYDNFSEEIAALKNERAEVSRQLERASGPVKEALTRRLTGIDAELTTATEALRREYREVGQPLTYTIQVGAP